MSSVQSTPPSDGEPTERTGLMSGGRNSRNMENVSFSNTTPSYQRDSPAVLDTDTTQTDERGFSVSVGIFMYRLMRLYKSRAK